MESKVAHQILPRLMLLRKTEGLVTIYWVMFRVHHACSATRGVCCVLVMMTPWGICSSTHKQNDSLLHGAIPRDEKNYANVCWFWWLTIFLRYVSVTGWEIEVFGWQRFCAPVTAAEASPESAHAHKCHVADNVTLATRTSTVSRTSLTTLRPPPVDHDVTRVLYSSIRWPWAHVLTWKAARSSSQSLVCVSCIRRCMSWQNSSNSICSLSARYTDRPKLRWRHELFIYMYACSLQFS